MLNETEELALMPHSEKAAFRDALEAWVSASLGSATAPDIEQQPRMVWVKTQTGGTQVPYPRLYWSAAFYERIRQTSEWEALVGAAAAWSALAEHLNVLVGSNEMGAGRVTLETFAYPFLAVPEYDVTKAVIHLPSFSKTQFERHFGELVLLVVSSEIAYESRTLFVGIKLDMGVGPFELVPGLYVDLLSDEEVQELGERDLLPSFPGVRGMYDWEGTPRVILRWRRSFPKRIGDGRASSGTEAIDAQAELRDCVAAFQVALALTKEGVVIPGWTDFRNVSLRGGGGRHDIVSIPVRLDRSTDMQFSRGDCEALKRAFRAVYKSAVLNDGSLAIATRRLTFAMARERPEDRYLDYMIAAEALFIESESKTEVGYRVRMRAAFALERSDRHRRRQIFENMKNAYDVRSAIAHGGKPDPKKLAIDGERVPLTTFISMIGDYVRTAVRIAIETFGEQFFPDNWDDFIVGEKATTVAQSGAARQ